MARHHHGRLLEASIEKLNASLTPRIELTALDIGELTTKYYRYQESPPDEFGDNGGEPAILLPQHGPGGGGKTSLTI